MNALDRHLKRIDERGTVIHDRQRRNIDKELRNLHRMVDDASHIMDTDQLEMWKRSIKKTIDGII